MPFALRPVRRKLPRFFPPVGDELCESRMSWTNLPGAQPHACELNFAFQH